MKPCMHQMHAAPGRTVDACISHNNDSSCTFFQAGINNTAACPALLTRTALLYLYTMGLMAAPSTRPALKVRAYQRAKGAQLMQRRQYVSLVRVEQHLVILSHPAHLIAGSIHCDLYTGRGMHHRRMHDAPCIRRVQQYLPNTIQECVSIEPMLVPRKQSKLRPQGSQAFRVLRE